MAAVSRTDSGIDTVTDAGLAIDEAAALLLGIPGTTVVKAVIGADPPTMVLASDAHPPFWPPESYDGSLAETVLSSVVSEVEFAENADGAQIRLIV